MSVLIPNTDREKAALATANAIVAAVRTALVYLRRHPGVDPGSDESFAAAVRSAATDLLWSSAQALDSQDSRPEG